METNVYSFKATLISWHIHLRKLCTMRVKATMGTRPLGLLHSSSTSCNVTFPLSGHRALQVLNSEYKSRSLRPGHEKEK